MIFNACDEVFDVCYLDIRTIRAAYEITEDYLI